MTAETTFFLIKLLVRPIIVKPNENHKPLEEFTHAL